MDIKIAQCARKLREYRQEMKNALSTHYPDVVVGRPYRMHREETELAMDVYSDTIQNAWAARGLPEVKAVIARAKEDGYNFILSFQPKQSMAFIP